MLFYPAYRIFANILQGTILRWPAPDPPSFFMRDHDPPTRSHGNLNCRYLLYLRLRVFVKTIR